MRQAFGTVLCLGALGFSSLFGGIWSAVLGGDYDSPLNWLLFDMPNGPGDTATFGNVITATQTVNLPSAFALGAINFDNANGYILNGGSINLYGPINVNTSNGHGAHTINSDLILHTATTISQGSTGDFTIAGVVSGTGSLAKEGAGTLVLSGANTYSGGTTISAGVLKGTTTSLQGAISNSGVLEFAQSSSGTCSGVISSSGSLVKSGSGTVTLTGANTYTGTTTINGGMLELLGDGRLGIGSDLVINSGSLSIAAGAGAKTIGLLDGGGSGISLGDNALTCSGGLFSGVISGTGSLIKTESGTLELTASNTYSGGTTISTGLLKGTSASLQGSLFNDGSLLFDQSFSGVCSGVISGSGSLVKMGAGTLTLAGANTYSGGTTIAAGVLKGDCLSLQGNIASDAEVYFDQVVDGTYAGVISGSGSLTKGGVGVLSLTGANTFTGGTTILGGVLQLNTNCLTGDIFNSGSLEFIQGITGACNGIISGTGAIIKRGVGTLILNGSHPCSGLMTVEEGVLQLNGSLGGNVSVLEVGTLSGTGQFKGLTNLGVVRPGNSTGTIEIDGDFNQSSSGNLIIEIHPDGSSDLLNVSGTANLAGTLTLNPLAGSYEAGASYTFLTAPSIVGQFDQLFETHPLDFFIDYEGNLARIVVSFSGMILPVPIDCIAGNAQAIADYLLCDGFIPDDLDLLKFLQCLVALPPEEFVDALKHLGPAQFGALPLVGVQNNTRVASALVKNVEQVCICPSCECTSVWIEALGYYYGREQLGDEFGFRAETYGAVAGISRRLGNGFYLGGGVGYTHSEVDWKSGGGSGDWNTVYVGPSIGWVCGCSYLNLAVLGAWNFFDMDRKVVFEGVNRVAHNRHDGWDVLARVDGGFRFPVGKCFHIQPEARLSYLSLYEEAYTESGAGSINLSVSHKRAEFLQPQMRVKLIKECCWCGFCVAPTVYAGWIADIPLSSGDYVSRFHDQGGAQSDFTVRGFGRTSNRLVLGGELVVANCCGFRASIGYDANLLDRGQIHEGRLRLEKRF